MLSRQGSTVFSGVALCLALSVPAAASEPAPGSKPAPVVSFCEDIRQDMLYYHRLFQQGGTLKQEEVWKKRYKQEIWNWGHSKCPAVYKNMIKRLAESRKAAKPLPQPQAPDTTS